MSVWRTMARGFTLIEMSIVMVVIGLVVSGGIVAARPIIENSKVADTKAKLDRIEGALLLHAIRYGCLPCPATSNATGGTAGQGLDGSSAAYTGCTSGCAIDQDSQGIVPWRNLDLSEAEITDGFGTRISYALGSALSAANSMNRSGSNYDPPGDLTVDAASNPATDITDVAAYVLISHGPNRVFGFLANSGAEMSVDPNNSTPEEANSDGRPFAQGDRVDASGATHFDDIVRWRTKPIITQLCGAGSCGNPS